MASHLTSSVDERCGLFLQVNHDVAHPAPHERSAPPRRVDAYRAWRARRSCTADSDAESALAFQMRVRADRRRQRAVATAQLEAERARYEQRLLRRGTADAGAANGNRDEGARAAAAVAQTPSSLSSPSSSSREGEGEGERRSRFSTLPFGVRARVFEFVPAPPAAMVEDMRFICTFLPEPREVENVLDERREALALAHDDVEILLFLGVGRDAP